jgi:diguanylate cyclase
MTDKETGAWSRRYFFKRLTEDRIPFAEKHNDPLTVTVFDLNKFKHVNDTYGHSAGDYVLREVARIAKETCPSPSIVARVGGDEFAIISPGQTEQDSYKQAEKLRKIIEKHTFEYVEQEEDEEITYGLQVTFASGVRQYESGLSADELYKGADRAFYMAHMNGKNRTEKFTDFINEFKTPTKRINKLEEKNIISKRKINKPKAEQDKL